MPFVVVSETSWDHMTRIPCKGPETFTPNMSLDLMSLFRSQTSVSQVTKGEPRLDLTKGGVVSEFVSGGHSFSSRAGLFLMRRSKSVSESGARL